MEQISPTMPPALKDAFRSNRSERRKSNEIQGQTGRYLFFVENRGTSRLSPRSWTRPCESDTPVWVGHSCPTLLTFVIQKTGTGPSVPCFPSSHPQTPRHPQ